MWGRVERSAVSVGRDEGSEDPSEVPGQSRILAIQSGFQRELVATLFRSRCLPVATQTTFAMQIFSHWADDARIQEYRPVEGFWGNEPL